MKKIISILVIGVMLTSCGKDSSKKRVIPENVGRIIYDYGWNTKVRVFEIDSCEYIGFDSGTESGTSIIHKQNCNFCAKRNENRR